MDATLHALGGILLRALPTFFLVLLLHFYLKSVFFKPLGRVLEQRYEATEGARKLAEASLAQAAAKTAEYEAAMRAARAETYQALDRLHKRLQDEHTQQVDEARRSVEATVKAAKDSLAADVNRAKGALAAESEAMSNQIVEAVLRRSAA